jgi:hypothetical protein
VSQGTVTYLPFLPMHSVNVKWIVKLPPFKNAVTHKLITLTTIITNALYHPSFKKKMLTVITPQDVQLQNDFTRKPILTSGLAPNVTRKLYDTNETLMIITYAT